LPYDTLAEDRLCNDYGVVVIHLGPISLITDNYCLLSITKYAVISSIFIAMIPALFVMVPVIIITPHTHGLMMLWVLAFTVFLSFMAWSAICTVHRSYYERKYATRSAIAGYFMFLSDMGMGFGFFYPGLDRNIPWHGTEIWITYIPAWTLILMNLSEEKLRRG
jgi:hypothetical protein